MQPVPLRLWLDGALTIGTAEIVRDKVMRALAECHSLQIDCSEADSVDLSLIQVLLAARRSAGDAGKTLTIVAPAGGALRGALTRGGFVSSDDPADDPAAIDGDPFWLAAP